MATSKVMSQIITDVEKELNDVPLFMETYKNSIVDYQSRNGKMPLMPLSQITFLFNFNSLNYLDQDNNTIYKLPLIPIKEFGLGSPEFKFTYGTRGLLSQD